MKLHELIKQLESFNPELEVFVRGYEYGFHNLEPEFVYAAEITLNEWSDPKFGGAHDIGGDGPNKVLGLVIDRARKW